MSAPMDAMAQANRDYLAGGRNGYERLRHASLNLLRLARQIPDWRSKPDVVQLVDRERRSLAINREMRDVLKRY